MKKLRLREINLFVKATMLERERVNLGMLPPHPVIFPVFQSTQRTKTDISELVGHSFTQSAWGKGPGST